MEKRMDIGIEDIRIIAERCERERFLFDCPHREYDGFVYFIKGEGTLCVSGTTLTVPVTDGALFWFRQGDAYRFTVEAGCRYITSDYRITHDRVETVPSLWPTLDFPTEEQGLAIEQMVREWESHRPTSYMRCKIALLALYTDLLGKEAAPVFEHGVRAAVDFIHKNYRRPFTGEELSAACAISPSHLRQRFRTAIGMTVTEYRDSLRISAAREMLESGLFTPKEAAADLGYSDVSHFTKVFTAKVGTTPAKYARKKP